MAEKGLKFCRWCKETKPINKFPRDRNKCNACKCLRAKELKRERQEEAETKMPPNKKARSQPIVKPLPVYANGELYIRTPDITDQDKYEAACVLVSIVFLV